MGSTTHPNVTTKAMARHTAEIAAGGNGTLAFLKAYREAYEDLARGENGVPDYLNALDQAIQYWESGRKPDFSQIDAPIVDRTPITFFEKLVNRITSWRKPDKPLWTGTDTNTVFIMHPAGANAPFDPNAPILPFDPKGSFETQQALAEMLVRFEQSPSAVGGSLPAPAKESWADLVEEEHGKMTPERADSIIEGEIGLNQPLMAQYRGGLGSEYQRKIVALHYLMLQPD